MNRLTKTILLITAVAIFSAGFLASTAQAGMSVPPLAVEFEGGSPLFNQTNFTPGDSVTKWVKVTNTSGLTQRIAIEAINFTKPVPEADLSRALMILIKQGATEIYGGAGNEKTLYQFYQNGETYLSELANNNTAQYDITISFPADKGDFWQEKTTGFNMIVGFEGTEGGLPLPLPGGSANVSGGGGSNGPPGLPSGLTIHNEAIVVPSVDSVTIIWITSYPASSQVIYALENESHILDLTDNVGSAGFPPKYGYSRTTPEYDSFLKVLNHSVTIDGLTPGTTYYYRSVSHGSLAISYEHSFTTLTLAEAATKKEQLVTLATPEGGAINVEAENVREAALNNYVSPSNITSSGAESEQGSAENKAGIKGQEAAVVLGFIPQNYFFLFLLILFISLVFITHRVYVKSK